MKDVPVAKAVPPVEAANQLKVPADAVAPNVTVPVPQLEPGVVVATVGIALTVATTSVRADDRQPPSIASA